jgi:hypothetical protein
MVNVLVRHLVEHVVFHKSQGSKDVDSGGAHGRLLSRPRDLSPNRAARVHRRENQSRQVVVRGRSLVHEALCLLPCRDQFPLKLGVCVLEGSDAAFKLVHALRFFVGKMPVFASICCVLRSFVLNDH